jgi:uroporphyrinogen decarboxylase
MRALDPETWKPLPRAEVVKALERNGPSRIPLVRAKWWGEGLREQYGHRLDAFDRYPEDAAMIWIEPLDVSSMGLSWEVSVKGAHDARSVIYDWQQLDEFINKMPDPKNDPQFDGLTELAHQIRAQDQYMLFGWWRLFFERPWGIRGMQNLLTDYYLEPDNIHRLHDALCNLYCGYIERAIHALQPDGFWTSDDLGHQTQLFMRPQLFREFIKPYYARVGQCLEQQGVHWWLHSCGNNTDILGDLVEVGLDVFHPVQKGTMDEISVARDYGEQLTFLVGIDVQHILQERDPEGVRREVRFLIDTFDRPGGGMCIAAGNGIVAGTPIENIEAFLDESVRYGTAHREAYRTQCTGCMRGIDKKGKSRYTI